MDVVQVLSEENTKLREIALELKFALEGIFQNGSIPDELLKQSMMALEKSDDLINM